jgi:hypothetical protein
MKSAMRPLETNVLAASFIHFPGAPEPNYTTSSSTQRNVICEFWRSSAYLCGSIAYRTFLAEMRSMPGFADTWKRIAYEPGYILEARLPGAPFDLRSEQVGFYRTHPVPITIPPTYHMRVMIPMDETASRLQQEAGSALASRTVSFSKHNHWSYHLVAKGSPFAAY